MNFDLHMGERWKNLKIFERISKFKCAEDRQKNTEKNQKI